MSAMFLCSGKLAPLRHNARLSTISVKSYGPTNSRQFSALFSHTSFNSHLKSPARTSHGLLSAQAVTCPQRRNLWWKSSPPSTTQANANPVSETASSSSAAATIAPETRALSESQVVNEAVVPESPIPPTTGEAADVVLSSATSTTDQAVTTLLSSPPPLEYGDLAALGLISYTPAGVIRWSFELLQVTTALPWFHTIVVGSLLWRVLLTPFVVQNLQNTARLQPLQPKLLELREEMAKASQTGDRLAMQRCALKQKKIYGDAGVSMWKMLVTPFVQLPVTLGIFFGLKKMCNLPVEQLKDSGVSWLPDLTVPDPYGVLPWALMLVVNLQISAGAREMNLKERPEMGHLMNGLRILTLGGVYVMGDFPSGLMVSLLVTSTATTAQTLLLQSPTIRRYFDIPIVSKEHKGRLPSYKESVNFVIKSFKDKLEEGRKQQQQELMRRRR
ncbi:hypothetical protein ONZ45_g13615 [Pleurotus djamor]|nr:hypothetical protein ONZ45_g13615 [Pleurotus djamor]